MIQSLLIGSIMGGHDASLHTKIIQLMGLSTYLMYINNINVKKMKNIISTLLKSTSNIFVMGGQKWCNYAFPAINYWLRLVLPGLKYSTLLYLTYLKSKWFDLFSISIIKLKMLNVMGGTFMLFQIKNGHNTVKIWDTV